MVLEQIIGSHWIERKPWYAFLIGIFFTIISLFSALLVFGSDPGYMVVAFITILMIPTLSSLLKIEMNQELRENRFDLIQLFKDHYDIIEVYFFLFMGIFFSVFLISFMFPVSIDESYGKWSLQDIFRPQFEVAKIKVWPDENPAKQELRFGDQINKEHFLEYLSNNTIVLLVCFFLSLIYGAGSFLFLTWNATTWGAIIGYRFREIYQIGTFPTILPHLITETIAYLGAAIAGGILSKALLREKFTSRKFGHIFVDALLVLGISFIAVVVGAAIEAMIV